MTAPKTAALAVVVLGLAAAISPVSAQCQRGPEYFDYGPHRYNQEAEQLAMYMSGEIRAPDYEYDRISNDLWLIRNDYPILLEVINTPEYDNDELIVRLYPDLPTTGYEDLNAYYQVIDDEINFTGSHALTYCDNIHAPVLALEYETLPEVEYAQPSWTYGGADFISIEIMGEVWRYSIDDGIGDCPTGCLCERRWIIDVDAAGTVSLVSYEEWGDSSCDFYDAPCCLPQGACDEMSVGSCLGQNGRPLSTYLACDGDYDSDGLDSNCSDNCPYEYNPGQGDSDHDYVGDACDNCPEAYNPDQLNGDWDDYGDVCDDCPWLSSPVQGDGDSDGYGDVCDNCPAVYNVLQQDTESDSVGDLCDNCTFDVNPAQSDGDSDTEGDVCDLDDGLIFTYFESREFVNWQAESGFDLWNSYKGDLAVLKDEGIYTQLPGSNAIASQMCDLGVTFVRDFGDLDPGKTAFYLTTGQSGGVESSLGTAWQGVERFNANPCP